MKKETKTPSEQKQTNAKDNRYDLRELPLSQHLDRLWSVGVEPTMQINILLMMVSRVAGSVSLRARARAG